MSPIDVAIPLAIGLLAAFRPQIFFKATGSDEEIGKKRAILKKVGYVLIGVAVLYALIAVAQR